MSRFLTLSLIILLSACCAKKATSQKNTAQSAQKTSLSGTWEVTSLDQEKTLAKKPTLVFEKGKISGNAGCNNYSSDLTIKDNTISFGLFIKTKMYCDHMKTEDVFIRKLKKIKSYKIEDDKLKLYAEDGTEVISCIASE